MAHRDIAKLNNSNLSSIAYGYNGEVLDDIKVFRIKLSTAKIVPAALNGTRTTMSQINPIGESTSKVMEKTNAATMKGSSGTGFYGIFYANKQLFCSSKKFLLRMLLSVLQSAKMVKEFLIFALKLMVQ